MEVYSRVSGNWELQGYRTLSVGKPQALKTCCKSSELKCLLAVQNCQPKITTYLKEKM